MAVAPLNKDSNIIVAGGSEMGGPQKPSSGAAIGRFVESAPNRMPGDRPSLYRQVREPPVKVVMEHGSVQPGCSGAEANCLQIIASYAGGF